MTRLPLHGLYLITDAGLTPGERLAPAVAASIRGGAAIVQYRDKGTDWPRRRQEAEQLRKLCAETGTTFIINDDVELALAVGADGVHLGKEDAALQGARRRLGPGAIIGVSCYNRLEAAVEAQRQGADYVAFGSFHPSPTKPEAVRAEPSLLVAARQRLGVPVVAIGGITAHNGGHLVEAGAHMLAVISAVLGADDIEAAARAVTRLFT